MLAIGVFDLPGSSMHVVAGCIAIILGHRVVHGQPAPGMLPPGVLFDDSANVYPHGGRNNGGRKHESN